MFVISYMENPVQNATTLVCYLCYAISFSILHGQLRPCLFDFARTWCFRTPNCVFCVFYFALTVCTRVRRILFALSIFADILLFASVKIRSIPKSSRVLSVFLPFMCGAKLVQIRGNVSIDSAQYGNVCINSAQYGNVRIDSAQHGNVCMNSAHYGNVHGCESQT
jgi:hypothetical protein